MALLDLNYSNSLTYGLGSTSLDNDNDKLLSLVYAQLCSESRKLIRQT